MTDLSDEGFKTFNDTHINLNEGYELLEYKLVSIQFYYIHQAVKHTFSVAITIQIHI